MINGGLFTHDFLIEGIRETELWATLTDAGVNSARVRALALFERLTTLKTPTEAVTEKDLIYPMLSNIGWNDLVFVQPNASAKGTCFRLFWWCASPIAARDVHQGGLGAGAQAGDGLA